MPQGSFLRGALALFSGNVAAQAIVVLSSPVLTRLYGPADFGVLGVYVSILAFVNIASGLRYEPAIILPRSDVIATGIVAWCLTLVAGSALIIAAAIGLAGESFAKLLDIPAIEPYLWLLPVAALAGGSYKVLTLWAVRMQDLGVIAKTRIQQNSVLVSAQMGIGYFHTGPAGLLLGHVLGVSSGLLRLVKLFGRTGFHHLCVLRRKHIRYAALRYRRFFQFSLGADLLNVFALQLPVVLLTALFSPAVAGYYVLAERVIRSPIAMVSDATGKTIMSVSAKAHREGALPILAEKIFRLLLQAGLGFFILFGLLAPDVFSFIFGVDWRVAGEYMQVMTPMFFSVFVFVPLLTLLSVMEKQKHDLLFQGTLVVFAIGGLMLGVLYGNEKLAIALYSTGATFSYTAFGLWTLKLAGLQTAQLRRTLGKEIVPSFLLGGVLYYFFAAAKYHSFHYQSLSTWFFCLVIVFYCIVVLMRMNPVLNSLKVSDNVAKS